MTAATGSPHRRILVIDDNEAIHEDIRRILQFDGVDPELARLRAAAFGGPLPVAEAPVMRVDAAGQGQEGLELLQRAMREGDPYCAALVDVRMPPGWDGIETIRHLWAADPRLEVVICTAYSDQPWHEIAGALGRTDRLLILKKPFDAVEVRQLALALTTKWHLARAAEARHRELESLVRQRTAELEEQNRRLRREIEHREQAEVEQARLREQLFQSQKMEAVGRLANGVAHDFHNLLTVVRGCAERLRISLAGREDALGAVDTIERAVGQATGVARSLLDFCRFSPSEKVPVDLGALVEDTCGLLRHMLPAAVEMTVETPRDGGVWVRANRVQLQQVVMNLVINARDAMPQGGRLTLRVTRGVWEDEPVACLTVADTGAGMPPEVREHAFDPFFTTKPRDRGTGLGLPIVHGIVMEHWGHVEIRSEPGRGCEVTVALPLTNPASAEALTDVSEPAGGNGELILLAEAHRPTRELIASALASFGYAVVQAADGDAATELYRKHRRAVRALVLGADLPGRSGLECLHEVRRRAGAVPAVILVGDSGPPPGDVADAEILRKPFAMTRLAAAVYRMLNPAACRPCHEPTDLHPVGR